MKIIYCDAGVNDVCVALPDEPPLVLPMTSFSHNGNEYNAIKIALVAALARKWRDVTIRSDSQLAIRQLNGEYAVRDIKLQPLWREVKSLAQQFNRVIFEWVPREQNLAGIRLEKGG